jgi:hypothetical protein
MVGIKSKITHHFGRLIIFIKMTALYMGTAACHALYPAATYSFQVPKK